MADTVSPEVRSFIMSRIRSEGTGPELELRSQCEAFRLPFVPNDRSLPGSPDLAFHDGRLAVFVHGCFWHGCPEHHRTPSTRPEFWRAKIERNRERDARDRRRLNRMGWSVMAVWEHEVRAGAGKVAARIARRLARVRGRNTTLRAAR